LLFVGPTVLLAGGLVAYLWLGETPHHAAFRRVRLGSNREQVVRDVAAIPAEAIRPARDRDVFFDRIEFQRLVNGVPEGGSTDDPRMLHFKPFSNAVAFGALDQARYYDVVEEDGERKYVDPATRAVVARLRNWHGRSETLAVVFDADGVATEKAHLSFRAESPLRDWVRNTFASVWPW
jgi:hypothetical protein